MCVINAIQSSASICLSNSTDSFVPSMLVTNEYCRSVPLAWLDSWLKSSSMCGLTGSPVPVDRGFGVKLWKSSINWPDLTFLPLCYEDDHGEYGQRIETHGNFLRMLMPWKMKTRKARICEWIYHLIFSHARCVNAFVFMFINHFLCVFGLMCGLFRLFVYILKTLSHVSVIVLSSFAYRTRVFLCVCVFAVLLGVYVFVWCVMVFLFVFIVFFLFYSFILFY